MVSEITRFYCKPDMTSSWFLRLGALQMIIQDRFWKSEHDFLIVIQINVFICDAWFPRYWDFIASKIWCHRDFFARGRYQRFFMTNSDRATMTSWWRSIKNILSRMHGFRDNEVSLQAWYDVNVIYPPRGRFRRIFMTECDRATMTSW